MNQFVVEQNTVRYEINPLLLLDSVLRQSSEMNPEDFINHRPLWNEWAVQFSNIHELPTFYIQQLFSRFGRVNSVVQSRGSSNVYVNFANENDAKKCVYALRYQTYIQLLPFRRNNFSNNTSGNPFAPQNDSHDENYKARQKPLLALSNDQKNGDFFSPKSDAINGEKNVNIENMSSMEGSVDSEISINNSQDSSKKFDNRAKSCGKLQEDMGKEISPGNAVKSVEKAQRIITAQEVIVGNIPEAFGVPYILHLLERYQPICISGIKTVGENFVRYCHVYFETPAHAEAAEANYDEVELNGKKLIVMRPHVLAVQAMRADEI